MKKIIYISILGLLILVACSDDNEIKTNTVKENKVASFDDYFDFLNTETDGNVLAQSVSTPLSNEAFMVSSSIKGDRAPLDLKVENKTISFKKHQYSVSAKRSYSNKNIDDLSEIFGNNFNIEATSNLIAAKKIKTINSSVSINSSATSTASGSVESVYIPNVIRAQFSGLENDKIVVGSEIIWNIDNQNENGVVISFEYDPLSQIEENIVNQKADNLLKGITTEDDGIYTITPKDLMEFPENAIITIYVARAGFGISTNTNGEDYSLAGVTAKVADFHIKK